MAVSMSQHLMAVLPELRYQRTPKHLRIRLAGDLVADSTGAVLIWEPRRVVPSYALPIADIAATLTPAPAPAGPEPDFRPVRFGTDGPPLLDPSVPFAVHTAPGRPMTVTTPTASRESAAFRLDDEDLPDHVILDFDAFDWWEEDEPIVGHPRDPFHRIDVRRTSQRIRIEHDGIVLAETDRASALFEAAFPLIRYYLPAADVLVQLTPGTLRTTCAYKGHASHLTAIAGGRELANIAWTYPDPLPEMAEIAGLISFYQERLDVSVDGRSVRRVRTPWT
jgi:uncharacterized protein (DUF427 family)